MSRLRAQSLQLCLWSPRRPAKGRLSLHVVACIGWLECQQKRHLANTCDKDGGFHAVRFDGRNNVYSFLWTPAFLIGAHQHLRQLHGI